MDINEHDRLVQSVKGFNSPVAPREYVERGVSRRTVTSRRTAISEKDAEPSEKNTGEATVKITPTAVSSSFEPTRSGRNVRPGIKSGRRFNSRSASSRRLREDEQPPLLDSLRQMVAERRERRLDFDRRYEQSSAGASHVEQERTNGGKVISDVEYFVPKISSGATGDIDHAHRKRKIRNKTPMRMWKKASLTSLSLFMAFVLFLGMGISSMLDRINFVNSAQNGSMNGGGMIDDIAGKVDDSELELPDAVRFDSDIENILLIGSDRRSIQDLGRSDAMMILTIDRKHKKIKMTSLLRDLYVKIPNKFGTKLNAVYANHGVKVLKETIEANLGITVDRYVIVDFNAFRTVVNKIGKANGKGGIKITVTAAEAHYMCSHEVYGNFPRFQKGAGTYYMNGAEALNYARIRKIDSDFGRTNRQRKVLTQCITEAKSMSYMDLVSMAYSCLEYVTTDISKGELVGLAADAAEIVRYDINQISIPINGSYKEAKINASSTALAANLNVNAQKLAAFIYDDDMTYEGNQKKITGIYLPDLKGIENANVTTKKSSTTSSTTSTTSAAGSSGGQTSSNKTVTTKAAPRG